MAKLHEYNNGGDGRLFVFHCPGCGYDHPFHVGTKNHCAWTWNGSMDRPTFHPSLLVFKDSPSQRCHSWVKDGKIQFLSDCFHKLAGKTVDIPEWDEWD
jgi:hypothetical protein